MSRRKPISENGELFERTVIFFPHSRKDYGSDRAQAAEHVIKRAWPGCEIVDPKVINWKALGKQHGARVDEAIVRDCAIVVGLEHQEHIGRGVFGGLYAGLRLGKQVYVVRDSELVRVLDVEHVDEDDWAVRYGRVVIEA